MTLKKALITGIAGQDGAYLAQYLLGQGYEVHGLMRWDSDLGADDRLGRLAQLGIAGTDITLHTGDVNDPHAMLTLVHQHRFDEIYNLAAISHVAESFKTPTICMDIIVKGTLNILEAVRRIAPTTKIYQASSSEMFGAAPAPQNETTPMIPQSPYAAAKLHAYNLVRIYRESYGLFAANGILFNHESPLRGADFVTQKIAECAAKSQPLTLGNLEAKRDWGHAQDFIEGMHLMLSHDAPDDFVLATGIDHTVRTCAEIAYAHAGAPIEWQGEGLDEVGLCTKSGDVRIRISSEFFRPLEVHHLRGDASKAAKLLGWCPRTSFETLIAEMVDAAR